MGCGVPALQAAGPAARQRFAPTCYHLLRAAGGGTYSFLAEAAFTGLPLPPGSDQQLGIAAVNINGYQCSLAGGGTMRYGQCTAGSPDVGSATGPVLLPDGQSPAGGPAVVLVEPSDGGGGLGTGGGCWAQFCCGVVLVDSVPPAPPPSPPPPPPVPEVVLPPVSLQASPPQQPLPQPERPPGPALSPPQLPAQPGGSTSSGSDSSESASSGRGKGSKVVPAAAGGAGAAVLLLAAAAILLLVRRRRRRSRPEPHPGEASEASKPAPTPVSGSEVAAGLRVPTAFLQGSPTLSSILVPSPMLRQQAVAAAARSAGSGDLPAAAAAAAAAVAEGAELITAASAPGAAAQAVPPSGRSSSDSAGSGGSAPASCGSGSVDLTHDVTLAEQLGSGAFGTVYRGARAGGDVEACHVHLKHATLPGPGPFSPRLPGMLLPAGAGSWRGQPVAVKVLQTAAAPRSRELESFKQEAKVLAGLRHPNIVALLAACTGAALLRRGWGAARWLAWLVQRQPPVQHPSRAPRRAQPTPALRAYPPPSAAPPRPQCRPTYAS